MVAVTSQKVAGPAVRLLARQPSQSLTDLRLELGRNCELELTASLQA